MENDKGQPEHKKDDNGFNNKIKRRALLGTVAASAIIALVRTATGQTVPSSVPKPAPIPADPTKVLGPPPGTIGTRSSFEQLVKKPSDTSSRTPLQNLFGMITPSDLHFERHHGGVPVIDPAKYELLIHGMVKKPMIFTLNDLKKFPSVSRIAFLECSGNFRSGKEEMTPQEICGLTSQSEWTGVMLSTLFREVGVNKKATWFLAEGSDAAVMTRSIPVSKGWNDAMIAYGQNGEAIRPEQGYPARLFLPGWEGNANVKWIRRIEIADRPFMTREETSKYTDPLGDGTARMFSFGMDAKSIITFPAYPVILHDRGWWEIGGIAWSGRGRITRVDVSTDGGKQWEPAELQQPVRPKCHTRFRYLWKWDGRETTLRSRAVDETGYVQPTLEQLRNARGLGTAYHFNHIRAWRVQGDGTVVFGLEG